MRRGSINAPSHCDLGDWMNMQINNARSRPKAGTSIRLTTNL